MYMLPSRIIFTTHLKNKTGFGVEQWLSFSKSKPAIKRKKSEFSCEEPSDMGQKEERI